MHLDMSLSSATVLSSVVPDPSSALWSV